MRLAIAVIAVLAGVQAVPAQAYENFIPLGHNYARTILSFRASTAMKTS